MRWGWCLFDSGGCCLVSNKRMKEVVKNELKEGLDQFHSSSGEEDGRELKMCEEGLGIIRKARKKKKGR